MVNDILNLYGLEIMALIVFGCGISWALWVLWRIWR